jgi:hypothetical protein
MSRRGADNRQRELTLPARLNEREAEAIRQMADHAGVSVAAVVPGAVLNAPIPRAARRPRVNHEMVPGFSASSGGSRISCGRRPWPSGRSEGPACCRCVPRPRRDAHGLLSGHEARAMILTGNQRAGGNDLATQLMNEFDNEHRGKMCGCNLYLGDRRRRLGIGGLCMNLGRTQTKSHVHPTPRSCADITYDRSARYSDPEDYFRHRRPPSMMLTEDAA